MTWIPSSGCTPSSSALPVRPSSVTASGVGRSIPSAWSFVGRAPNRPSSRPPEEFTDFYELMQISPAADLDTIHRVYRLVAARYHPDNIHTGDLQKFSAPPAGLRDGIRPTKRAAYDTEYHFRRSGPVPLFELKDFVVGMMPRRTAG